MTPELEYLQVKWAAHLPYAAATRLLCEILPVSDAISVSSTKRRVRAVGATLDQSFGHPANKTNEQLASGVPPVLTALAVDSG